MRIKNIYFKLMGVGFVICMLVVCYMSLRDCKDTIDKEAVSGLPFRTDRNQWKYVSDLFVPQGQKYRERDGIIYECFGGGVFKRVSPLNKTRDFSIVTNQKGSKEAGANRRISFEDIYQRQVWQRKKGGNITAKDYQASGTGSSLKAAQAPLTLLNSLIDRLKIFLNKPVITIVDIPCGDFFWMRELVGRRSDVHYTGIDIVESLIEKHKKEYKSMKNAQFKNLDIVESYLGQSYDIILSRDMLQHLSHADALTVMEHFSTSGSKVFVATNMLSQINVELNSSQEKRYRPLNLMLPPFNLIPPLCSIRDDFGNNLKELAVWGLPLKQRIL